MSAKEVAVAARIGTIVSLSLIEQNIARHIAKARHNNNRKKNVQNSKLGPQSDETTDLEGVGAELAFCKLFNLYPDLTIYIRKAEDDVGDVRLPDSRKVDVKSTRYKTGRLLAVPWKKPTGDLFALMTGEFPNYEFRGVMAQNELLRPERLGNLGYGPTYIAEQEELEEVDVDAVGR